MESALTYRVSRFRLALIYGAAVFSALTASKFASLQAEDALLIALFGLCLGKLVYGGGVLRIHPFVSAFLKVYTLLIFILIFLALYAFRQTFYPLYDTSLLKTPTFFSFSKIFQFIAIICGFLWVTNVLIRSPRALAGALKTYWWTGIVSSCYALLSFIALLVTHADVTSDTPLVGAYAAGGVLRARGFFVEGGPFGLYLVSVFIVGLLRRRVFGRRLGSINLLILSLAFLLSASKAGFFVILLLSLYLGLAAASFRKRILYLVLSSIVLGGAAIYLDLGNSIQGYFNSYEFVETRIDLLGRDPNLVLGRVAAAYIVPRMIKAHPLAGIGFGNYPIIRNDPKYRGNLPAITDLEDLPGLGYPGVTAEIGIPATMLLLFLLFWPYKRTRKCNSIIAIACLFQPLAHGFGVQLTFFYPWFLTSCAIAAFGYTCPSLSLEQKKKRLSVSSKSFNAPMHLTSSQTWTLN